MRNARFASLSVMPPPLRGLSQRLGVFGNEVDLDWPSLGNPRKASRFTPLSLSAERIRSVHAGQIARQTGFKEGQAIRVFPFGYVAHDAAADPASLLHAAVTVGSDGVIGEIAVSWGTWTYTVTYSDLGSTRQIVAPARAKSLRELRHLPPQR